MKIKIIILGLSAMALVAAWASEVTAAPRDMSRHPVCASFARNAVKWQNSARGWSCRLSGAYTKNEGAHYNWCMGTSDAEFRGRSAGALGHKANLEKACSRQLRQKIQLY